MIICQFFVACQLALGSPFHKSESTFTTLFFLHTESHMHYKFLPARSFGELHGTSSQQTLSISPSAFQERFTTGIPLRTYHILSHIHCGRFFIGIQFIWLYCEIKFARFCNFIWKISLTYRITTPYAAARFSCSDNDIRIQFLYSDDLGGSSDHVPRAVSRGLVAV